MEKLKEFLKSDKFKELFWYVFFGVLTTIVAWGSYSVFVKFCNISVFWGNLLSWVCGVLFAFVTNKLWVFNSKSWAIKTVAKEFVTFVGSRAITGAIEVFGVPLIVKIGFNQSLFLVQGLWAKISVSVIVVILNYVFSKLFVFTDKKKKDTEA